MVTHGRFIYYLMFTAVDCSVSVAAYLFENNRYGAVMDHTSALCISLDYVCSTI